MKRMIGSIRKFLARNWHQGALILGAVALSGLLFGRHLGSLTGGVTQSELSTLASYSSMHAIIDNPLHAPLKILAWALWHIPFHNPAMLRAPFALFGVLSLVAFAYILKRWYGIRMAVMGVVLFACSSWLLHVSRIALFDVSFLWAGVSLVALHLWFHAHPDRRIVRFGWLIGMLALLFVPGMVWLIAANIFFQRDDLLDAWDAINHRWEKIVLPLIITVSFVIIGYVLFRHPHLGLDWLGVPHAVGDWKGMIVRLANDAAYFVIRGPHDPVIWLGRLPILDAFGTLMLATGLIFYAQHLRSFRTKFLGVMLILATILTAVSGDIRVSLLVPLAYAIIVGGMAFVLHQWLRVFPRNPLARSVGIGLIGLLVVASCVYNLRSYFIAWPHNTETSKSFTAALPSKN
jgi:hypothetical protein